MTLSLSLGCSVIAVKKPRPSPAHPDQIDCTDSLAPVLIDTLLVGASAVLVMKAALSSNENSAATHAEPVFFTGIAFSLATISLIYGSKNVNRCKVLKKAALTSPGAPSPPSQPEGPP